MSDIGLGMFSPDDAAVALRSLARRFRDLLVPDDEELAEEVAEIAGRIGPDGESAIDITSDTTRTLVLLHAALRQMTVEDDPVLHAAVLDPALRRWESPTQLDASGAAELLADTATSFAEDVARAGPSSWGRTGRVAGGGSTTALDVVKEAVRACRGGLDAATKTLEALRSD